MRQGMVLWDPSTATPSNTTLYFSRNNIVNEEVALALSLDVEKMNFNPSRGLSRRRGNPKQESLVLNNTATQLNNRRTQNSLQTKINILKDVSLWLPLPPFMQVNASFPWTPHIRVCSTNNISPSQTALSSQARHTLLGSAVDLVKLDLVLMQLPLFTLEGEKSS